MCPQVDQVGEKTENGTITDQVSSEKQDGSYRTPHSITKDKTKPKRNRKRVAAAIKKNAKAVLAADVVAPVQAGVTEKSSEDERMVLAKTSADTPRVSQ